MFVLETGLSEGYLTATARDYYDKDDVSSLNVPYANGSGVYGQFHQQNASNKWCFDALTFNSGSVSGSTIIWNRMADGALVAKYACATFLSDHAFDTAADISFVGWSNEYDDRAAFNQHATVAGNPKGSLFTWYQNATILGGAYKVCVVDVGVNSTEYASSSAKKYIADTSSSGAWGCHEGVDFPMFVQENRFTDFRMNGRKYGMFTSGFSYTVRDQISGSSGNCAFRLMAIPTNQTPILTPESRNLGVVTDAPTLAFQVGMDGAQITVSIDGAQKATAVSTGGAYSLDLTPYWSELSLAAHTVEVVATGNGYKCGATVSFTKSDAMIQVTGTPLQTERMATVCILKDTPTVPANATITREVTNNAMDQNPTWEQYTGERHNFSNEQKTADGWGVNWRITIDNSAGTSQARLATGVGMGFLMKGEIGGDQE